MNAVIIDQHPLHLEVCSLAVFFVAEFDKSILQAVSSLLISDDFTGQDLPKS